MSDNFKVGQVLRAFRVRTRRTFAEMAAEYGWPFDFYVNAEAGKVGLSEGQRNDVRRIMKAAVDAACAKEQRRQLAAVPPVSDAAREGTEAHARAEAALTVSDVGYSCAVCGYVLREGACWKCAGNVVELPS